MNKRSSRPKTLKGYRKASNKTTKFKYYFNPTTGHVFKDTNKNRKVG